MDDVEMLIITSCAPYNIIFSDLTILWRDDNKGFAEVTGPREQRGNIWVRNCYKLYGPKRYPYYRIMEIVEQHALLWLIST